MSSIDGKHEPTLGLRRSRRYWCVIAWTAVTMLVGLDGCSTDDGSGTIVVSKHQITGGSTTTSSNSSGTIAQGSIGSDSGTTASPTPSPTASPPPPSSSATPKPPAASVVAVTSVEVTSSASLLYIPAANATGSMGLPSVAQFSAIAHRADGSTGSVTWLDRSNGVLSVSTSGQIGVSPTAAAGYYTVRAQSVDDPNMYQDVLVQVSTLGELDISVQ